MQSLIRALKEYGNLVGEEERFSNLVLDAMATVDRGHFSPDPMAYSVSVPARIHREVNMTAADLHALALTYIVNNLSKPRDEVRYCLDVGTGTGYVATVMARLFPQSQIIGIDVIPELITRAKEIRDHWYTDIGDRLQFVTWNAYDIARLPHHSNAQYDVIHGGATAHETLQALLSKLAPGGVMVFPHRPPGYASQFIYFEELAMWTRDKDYVIHGPRSIAPVLYTPLVKSEYDSSSNSNDNNSSSFE